jgi:II/X family phage/plasmid replication protein
MMAIDTVKLRSPSINEGMAQFLEQQCILKSGVELSTGEILYEITTGDLEGSWDSRIMFKVMREEWLTLSGRLERVQCKPYVVVECSWHKFFYGQNVYGNPTDFQGLARFFLDELGEIMAQDRDFFPEPMKWQVCRVDWAEMFNLSQAAQVEFFRSLRHIRFPRRFAKEAKYSSAVHFPGAFTTFRMYSKGQEFKEHSAAVLRRALVKRQQILDGQKPVKTAKAIGSVVNPRILENLDNYKDINRKIQALQRLANNRLRVEVQINADKLRYDFKGRLPFVSEITDEYFMEIYQGQVFKFLKEGKSEMETVRTHDAVKARLNRVYGTRSANVLFAFWMQLSGLGEDVARNEYSKSQFYANRKKLVDAGVSWRQTDIFIIPNETALPAEFFPVYTDSRRCVATVSPRSVFSFSPVGQDRFFKQAA